MKTSQIECRRCRQWQEETLEEASRHSVGNDPPIFCGCRIHGAIAKMQVDRCSDYQIADDLYSICRTCGIPAPKVCLSLGECHNCTDTDFYCVVHCRGEEERVFCTHYQRLRSEGYTVVEGGQAYELFPAANDSPSSPSHAPIIDLYDDSKEDEQE
jgi:hypothetical protein